MIHTDGIARELVKRGFDVEVIIQDSPRESQFKEHPYKLTELPGSTYSIYGQINFAHNLFKLLKKKDFNIIHGKNPFTSVLPSLFWRKTKGEPNVVYDIRGLWVDFGVFSGFLRGHKLLTVPILEKIDITSMKMADKVIAISDELKETLVEKGVNENLVKVIVGDGVNLEKARNAVKMNIHKFLGVKGKIIGYVGGIAKARSSQKLIDCFEIVKKRSKEDVSFVLIGPYGEERKRAKKYSKFFRELIHRKSLDKSVFLTGFVPHDEIFSYMKSFDVAISYHEGDFKFYDVAVPTKVLEYMATGIPIVATNHKMYKKVLTHRKNAYLTVQNPEAFAEGILHLLENPLLSKRLVKNALTSVKDYSFQKVAEEIEAVYEGVLEYKK